MKRLVDDSLDLANRINNSTDIVTAQEETIDAQHQTIDQTIVQARNEVMRSVTGLAQKIDNINFTPVENKLEEIEGKLIQGVTGLNQAVEEIKELVGGVTGYAKEDTF